MATTHSPPIVSSSPAWILLDSQVCIGDASHRNGSTALEARRNGKPIEVSVWAARPPEPSRLYVHCPDMEAGEVFLQQPCIVNTADGFVLLRLAVGCPPSSFCISSGSARIRREMNDYFIYRPAGPKGPFLKRLQKPPTHFFQNYEVALLPRGDHFTLAALSGRKGNQFNLQFFKSENESWDTKVVVLEKPQVNACRPFEQHITSTVITIGGECGTIGWVDLWRGILLCDLLTENHNLRYVPMPLPSVENYEEHIDCCPKPYRGIAVVGNSLKVVELEVHGDRLPYNDPETRGPNFRIHDWTLTTWSTYTNSKSEITNPWLDWVKDYTVKASDIGNKETVRSALLSCGKFCKPQNSEAAEFNLQNLYTLQPVLGLDEKGIVYLVTRLKFLHPKAWILAIDMRNNSVQAMIKIETERSKDFSLAYCGSTISSFMNATTPVVTTSA